MEGSLFMFDNNGSIAYKNNCVSLKKLVYINGLGGNILSIPCIALLNEYCIKNNYCLVIPQLRSMPNFQTISIEDDIEDIYNLVHQLMGDVVLIGHSTGCNDVVLFLNRHAIPKIKGVVLQAPVSDPENVCREIVEQNIKLIKASDPNKNYIEFENEGVWLKERYVSLYGKNGKEDVFSSYLDKTVFESWRTKVQTLLVISGEDEFCKVDAKPMLSLMGDLKVIEGADHSLQSEKSQTTFIELLSNFLEKIKF